MVCFAYKLACHAFIPHFKPVYGAFTIIMIGFPSTTVCQRNRLKSKVHQDRNFANYLHYSPLHHSNMKNEFRWMIITTECYNSYITPQNKLAPPFYYSSKLNCVVSKY